MSVGSWIGVALLLGGLVVILLAFRRLRVLRSGGADVALRRVRAPTSTRGWTVGVLRYRGDEIVWFRAISLRGGPDVRLSRLELEIIDRRRAGPAEEDYLMSPDATVLRCRDDRRTVELAMTPEVLTGFLSWLEATPPGWLGYLPAS